MLNGIAHHSVTIERVNVNCTILSPNDGNDTSVFTNKVIIRGTADSTYNIVDIAWTNTTTTQSGAGIPDSMPTTNLWWQTPVIELSVGENTCLVWSVDAMSNTSSTDSIVINYDTNGIPSDLSSYITGVVCATCRHINRQNPPISLGDLHPKFSWNFGDALNNNSPTGWTEHSFTQLPSSPNCKDIAYADLNGDELIDIALGYYDAPNYVLLNNGGSYSNWEAYLLGEGTNDLTQCVTINDINLDGRPDILFGNGYNYAYSFWGRLNDVYLNNGHTPDTWKRYHIGGDLQGITYSIEVADMTRNGLPDIIMGDRDGTYLAVNNGNTPDTWSYMRISGALPGGYCCTEGLGIADFNQDGYLDIVEARDWLYNSSSSNYVILGFADNPTNWTRMSLGAVTNTAYKSMGVAILDVDGDQRLDVAIANGQDFDQRNYVYLNTDDYPSNWPRVRLGSNITDRSLGLCAADINADGRTDLVVWNGRYSYNHIMLNNGPNPSNWPSIDIPGIRDLWTECGAATDLNGDSRLELIFDNHVVMEPDSSIAPYTQKGYQIQVAPGTNDLASGSNLIWDSGITASTNIGDGVRTIQQLATCISTGNYFWHIKLFSDSGYQGDWSTPEYYTIPSQHIYLFITNPPPPFTVITTSVITASGYISPWNMTNLMWTNVNTHDGETISSTMITNWSQELLLNSGENPVTFTAQGIGLLTTQSINIVWNYAPDPVILHAPVYCPDAGASGPDDDDIEQYGCTYSKYPHLLWEQPGDIETNHLHFKVYYSDSETNAGDSVISDSVDAMVNFDYWDGTIWSAFPSNGIASADTNILIRFMPTTNLALSATNIYWKIKAFDPYNSGPLSEIGRFDILPPSWTDQTLTARISRIRAEHITQLRSGMNHLRTAYSNPTNQWTDNPLVPLATPIRDDHIMELRESYGELVTNTTGNIWFTNWIDHPIIPYTTPVRTRHIDELRNAIDSTFTIPPYLPTNGMVGYWGADDFTPRDGSGHGLDGIVNNTVVFRKGRYGYAFSTDRSSGWIKIPQTGTMDFDVPDNYALVLWVYVPQFPYKYGCVAAQTSDTAHWYNLYITSDNRWRYSVPGSNLYVPGTISLGWNLLVLTQEGGNLRRIYVNGIEKANAAAASADGNGNIYLGYSDYGQEYFDGYLDDVTLYNRNLTSNEIYSIYEQSKP